MKKIVILMSLVLLTSLAWADSGTRNKNVKDQGGINYRGEVILDGSFSGAMGHQY